MADNEQTQSTATHPPESSQQDTLSLWEILDGARTPDQELLDKQINYLLRKWASLSIMDMTASVIGEQQTKREPLKKWRVVMRPGKAAELVLLKEDEDIASDGGEGGGPSWLIYDLGDWLLTSRPDAIAADYAGLAKFMQVIEKMVALAVEKGMQMINIEGYGGDMAWVAVEKYNIKQGEDKIIILNHGPTQEHATVYEQSILKPLMTKP